MKRTSIPALPIVLAAALSIAAAQPATSLGPIAPGVVVAARTWTDRGHQTRYEITLLSSQGRVPVAVQRSLYDACRVGSHWPACGRSK